uniref:Minor tail protein n=1 Tax=Siphoviridae sp. ctxMM9 TaxID=2827973 RepID=A0A8S5T636_9CAUD|nr:MAG TPA: minor tail protein [Siphoviridae sp. ctxMM9]
MAKFAQYANKAAKDLSTSTRSYADAALIYYQQGDSDAMAKKKAELTIKAANASFDSDAKEMSEYLTAVWNSYQVGSDQLEHYIDVMASLGAKTATSLEEIATSMQKVAATANTVGVSMEQMSSIISTVSSVTREAPESIGTSYKTILARMGDLKLGGSDEDGVTLGTVSSQLDKIGVKILDANNDLRDMGDIIWDLGEKWQTMNTATKSAVAQAVAGKRQYTQLMALFDNWDMYKENL